MLQPTLRPRKHAYGLTIMEVDLPEQPFLLLPDPGLTDSGGFAHVFSHEVEGALSTVDDADRLVELMFGRRVVDVYDQEEDEEGRTVIMNPSPDPELARYQLRRQKEIDALHASQPGDWGKRWYMSETGLRCRHCYTSFEDGDHAYWCPVG